MNGGNRVIAIDPGAQEAAGDAFLLTEEVAVPVLDLEPWEAAEVAESPASRRESRAAPLLAIAAAAGWTGLFAWSKLPAAIAGAPLEQWVGWIGEWAVPVALICVVWLLVMRNSKREAARFGDAARLLADESSRLEARLNTVNSELSLARDFIAAQARDLDSLGRVATERLTQSADRLQLLIQANSAQIDSIGSVSEAALDNMEKLRGQLPVIANSARDVTNNIGNAGRTAHAQLQEMINGFKRLNEFGQASERQVESMRELVGTTLEELNTQTTQIEETAERRFASILEKGGEFRGHLDSYETEALAALRARSEALAGEIERSRGKLDAQEAQSLASLSGRMELAAQRMGRGGGQSGYAGTGKAGRAVQPDGSDAGRVRIGLGQNRCAGKRAAVRPYGQDGSAARRIGSHVGQTPGQRNRSAGKLQASYRPIRRSHRRAPAAL